MRKASGIALEIVCIDSLEFIGADLPYPHIVVHHQSNQVRAVDQNDLDADGVREIHRILGVRGCRDEHALARTLALQRTGELLYLGSTHDRIPSLGLNVEDVQTELVLVDHSIDAAVTAPSNRASGLLTRAAVTHGNQ